MNPEKLTVEELTKIYLELKEEMVSRKDRGVLKKFYKHIKEGIC